MARPQPAPAAGSAGRAAAGHADDVPLGHMDFKKTLASIDDALPFADAQVHAELMLSHRLITTANRCATWKKALTGGGHGLEAQLEHLPEPVQRPVRAWLGLCESSESLSASWAHKPPDVARLTGALKDVNRVSPELSKSLQVALIKKANAAGKPEVARQLRDVKLDVAEEEVVLVAAVPRRDLLPLPEAPAGSQAGQKGSPLKGLADLGDEAREHAQRVYTRAVRQTERFGNLQYTLGSHHLHPVSGLASQAIEKKDQREKDRRRDQLLYKQVEGGLKRQLRPSERLIVSAMRGQTADAIIKTLAALD